MLAGSALARLRVRADAAFVNVGVVRSVSGTDVAGGLRDDTGQPLVDVEVTLKASSDPGTPTACPRGTAPRVDGSKVAMRTDSLGAFCVRFAPGAPVDGLVLGYSGDAYHGAATSPVPLETGNRRLSLQFEEPELSASLDSESLIVWVDVTAADGVGVGDPIRLVLSHRADPSSNVETEVGATDVQVGGRARFDVETRLLGAPGSGKLIVRFSGSAEFAPAEETALIERRATANLALAAAVPPSDPTEGVELHVAVSSVQGAVGEGWVEALADGQTVGIAGVTAGAARLVATFSPPRGRPAAVVIRYVPARDGFRPGESITAVIPIRPASPWGGAPWLVAAGAVGYWVVRAWRRPARAARGKTPPEPSATGRSEALLLERDATGSGWRGRVVDAHDGTAIEGARVTLVVPVFDGEGVAGSFLTGVDGSFQIAHVPAAKQEGARLVAAARHHATLTQPVPPDGTLAVYLVSRRRALLDRLVRWAREAGRPWSRRRGGEPTPLDVAETANHFNHGDVAAWAAAVEEAAFGPVAPDEVREKEIVAREPAGSPIGGRPRKVDRAGDSAQPEKPVRK